MGKNLLIVARWPLGGIRTYMRYMFCHFPQKYKLMVLAASTQENMALKKDTERYGAGLQLVQITDTHRFAIEIFKELRRNRYDVILSQGFISGVAVYMANLFFRVPHILTIHGIVEPKYLVGRFGALKRLLLARILSGVTVLYGVSHDILNHLYEQFPGLKKEGSRAIVIPNGIELGEFEQLPAVSVNLREKLEIESSTFLFGFFGRFMPQKGFDLLIDAVDAMRHQELGQNFAVVAVGSGDYLREYQAAIREKGLEQYFYFFPFQPQVHHLYSQVDAIVMASRWEASGLLAMEALCMGTPLIVSNCMGLRETVADTPAMVFPSENLSSLVNLMIGAMQDNNATNFHQFVPVARTRYDVEKSAAEFVQFIENLLEQE